MNADPDQSEGTHEPEHPGTTATRKNTDDSLPRAEPRQNHPRHEANSDEGIPKKWEMRIALFLALVNFAALIIYGYQLVEMRKATNAAAEGLALSRETAKIDQRAWITVYNIKLTKPLTIGEFPSVELTIRNAGKSPALNARFYADILGVEGGGVNFEPEESMVTMTEDRPSFIVAPGGSAEVQSSQDQRGTVVKQTQIDAILAGRDCLFWIGKVTYEDIFGDTHTTKFCTKLCKGTFESGSFIACNTGNSAN